MAAGGRDADHGGVRRRVAPTEGSVEGREVVGDVDQAGQQAAAHDRQRRMVLHGGRLRRRRPVPSTTVHVEFTEEQEALRKVVRDFADREIAPNAEAWDAEHTFPVEVVRRMGELGLFGIPFPERYGGGGADLTTLCIALEELARVDQSLAITLEAGVGLGANPIYRFGTEAQRQEWLPDLCAGRALGGFGLTEPDAGSDAAGTPGLTVQPPYRKMGWHASDTHGLSFSGCRVPAANLLGERGRGFAHFLHVLDEGRIAIAALAVGVIRCCLEQSVAY